MADSGTATEAHVHLPYVQEINCNVLNRVQAKVGSREGRDGAITSRHVDHSVVISDTK